MWLLRHRTGAGILAADRRDIPARLRGRAMSLATVANWGFNLVVSVTFLDLVGAFGSAGAFLVYAVLSVVALAFVARLVPETKGAQPGADRGRRWSAAAQRRLCHPGMRPTVRLALLLGPCPGAAGRGPDRAVAAPFRLGLAAERGIAAAS